MTNRSRQEQLMDRIEQKFEELQNTEISTVKMDAVQRNILLLGRKNSGKTTFRYTLAKPTRVSDELCLLKDSGTTEVEIIKHEKLPISLTMVDTKGLLDTKEDENNLVNIYELMSKRDITNFHFICYCISFEAGIRPQDINALKNIIGCYGAQIKPNLCMIIMRCESKTDEQRRRIQTDLEQDHQLKDIIKQFGQGIHFFGALNYDDWYDGNEALFNQFRVVYNYREKLLRHFCKDVKPCCIHISPKPTRNPISIASIDTPPVDGGYQHSSVARNGYVVYIYISIPLKKQEEVSV